MMIYQIKAFKINQITKNQGGRFVVVKNVHDEDVVKVATSEGRTLWRYQGYQKSIVYLVTLGDSVKPIAQLRAAPHKVLRWLQVDSVGVQKQRVGQGIGMWMYENVLRSEGHLVSSDDLSPGSSMVWAKLVRLHKGVFFLQNVFGRQGRSIKIIDFKVVKEMTYPVFERKDGGRICLSEIIHQYSGNVREFNSALGGVYVIRK